MKSKDLIKKLKDFPLNYNVIFKLGCDYFPVEKIEKHIVTKYRPEKRLESGNVLYVPDHSKPPKRFIVLREKKEFGGMV